MAISKANTIPDFLGIYPGVGKVCINCKGFLVLELNSENGELSVENSEFIFTTNKTQSVAKKYFVDEASTRAQLEWSPEIGLSNLIDLVQENAFPSSTIYCYFLKKLDSHINKRNDYYELCQEWQHIKQDLRSYSEALEESFDAEFTSSLRAVYQKTANKEKELKTKLALQDCREQAQEYSEAYNEALKENFDAEAISNLRTAYQNATNKEKELKAELALQSCEEQAQEYSEAEEKNFDPQVVLDLHMLYAPSEEEECLIQLTLHHCKRQHQNRYEAYFEEPAEEALDLNTISELYKCYKHAANEEKEYEVRLKLQRYGDKRREYQQVLEEARQEGFDHEIISETYKRYQRALDKEEDYEMQTNTLRQKIRSS